jgi:hypothetical protein
MRKTGYQFQKNDEKMAKKHDLREQRKTYQKQKIVFFKEKYKKTMD